MKKFVLFAATLLVGAFTLMSCNGGSAKDAASKFLTSLTRMNYEEAKKYATEDTKKQLDMMSQMSGMMGGGDNAKAEAQKAVVDITDVKEDGNNATVTYTVKPDGKTAQPGTQTLKMVKQSGKWLASWSKADQMGNMGADPSMNQPVDTSMMGTTPAMADTIGTVR